MHPVLFELPGGFLVRSFGVLLALGFILASWILARLAARHARSLPGAEQGFEALPVWILAGIVIGARLLYVLVEIARQSPTGKDFLERPWEVLAVWHGGLVMYGGLIGALCAGALCCARHRLPFWFALDLGLTAGFFGQAIGRVGCLLVGDDYGAVVPENLRHLPFPITLRAPDVLPEHSLFGLENQGQVLWATQPWMSAKALLLGLLGLWLLERKRFDGQVGLSLLLGYAVLRYGVECFRGDEVRGVWFHGALSTSQLLSIGVGAFALAALARVRRAHPARSVRR
jgi:phosphatidylglycerol:prolipoprotein diacylglycerol transferase